MGVKERIDFEAVRTASQRSVLPILHRICPGGRVIAGEYEVRNPRRTDRNPGSFRINVRTGRWADFATGDRGGDVISLVAYLLDTSQLEAARRLADLLSVQASK